MKTRILILAIGLSLGLARFSAAQGKADREAALASERDKLRMEMESLQGIRAEKLETLEKAEARRWDARYRQAAALREVDEKARALEEKYARLVADQGKLEEDLIRAGSATRDRESELEDLRGSEEAFHTRLRQAVEDAAGSLATDIPLELETRTLALSHAGDLLTPAKKGKTAKGEAFSLQAGQAMETYFDALLARFELTLKQSLVTREAVFEDGRAAAAWRLQLGTVAVAEMEKEGQEEVQLLLKTGTLQGRTYAWRSGLPAKDSRALSLAIQAAATGRDNAVTNAGLPMDVLQSRNAGLGAGPEETMAAWRSLLKFFQAGGVVIYPLAATALFALLLSLNRFLVFFRRGTKPEPFMKGLRALLDQGKAREAVVYCGRSGTSLGNVLGHILSKRGYSRDAAEKSAQESMLREIPLLEKWMALIAALGAAAPLLGLLGTVSGMITLFKVITEMGTNDPRILAGGISEALITTEVGLIIAIPVLLLHGVLANMLDNIRAAMNMHGMELMNRLWPEVSPDAQERDGNKEEIRAQNENRIPSGK